MKAKGRSRGLRLGLLGLLAGSLAGCQTWVGGETLPSGRYLQHQTQYFPPTPDFPLPRELAAQEAIAAAPPGGVVAPAQGAGPLLGPAGMPAAPPAPVPAQGPVGAPPAPGIPGPGR
jgi:hypothetical protein